MKKSLILLLIITLFLVSGCFMSKDKTTTLSEVYPGNIDQINKISIKSGSTGEEKEIIDKEVMHNWLNQVKDIELAPDPDQEERDGFVYSITLYGDDESKYTFSLGLIGKTYYIVNNEMLRSTDELFNNN